MKEDYQYDNTKKRKKNIKEPLKKYFCEYCGNTSMHGFRYIGEENRTYTEKFLWMIMIMCSLAMCLYLIALTYRKWVRSPVIVSFATEQTPIWQIPFPSVTICPETKARQSKYNLTQMYRTMLEDNTTIPELDRLHFEYAALVCSVDLANFQHKVFGNEVLDYIVDISPTMDELFEACKWWGEIVDCEDLFTPIWTDEGICFTFNMLDRNELYNNKTMLFYKDFLNVTQKSEWFITDGYKSNNEVVYPRRALYAGATSGLEVMLYTRDEDLNYICGDSLQGYKVSLTHPAMTPIVGEQYFRLPLNQSIVAAIKPVMLTTSETVKNYHPNLRKCYLGNEKELHYFNIYTEQSCEIECLSNFTYYKCGCVDIYMPHNESVPLCGPANSGCLRYAIDSLLVDFIDLNFDRLQLSDYDGVLMNQTTFGDKPDKCGCLPSCTSLEYDVETSQNDFPWDKILKEQNLEKFELEKSYMSHLVVFFKNSQFITSERNELYGTTDFLANCGGLLGLFIGFSVLSFVEILYYVCFRWIFTKRIKNNKCTDPPVYTLETFRTK